MGKFKSFMGKLKKNIFMLIVVWLILAILLVAPVTYTFTQGNMLGLNILENFSVNLVNNILKFPITEVLQDEYINDFIQGMKIYTLAYIIITIMAIYKNLPKGEYHNIEHGSSDWCENGEQYKVLDKKKGLILAKDHYLPVDKPGNVNVLIVGRFRFW